MSDNLVLVTMDEDIINFKLPVIDFDVDQVKQQLTEALKKYDGLTFTEDDVKDLKSTITELNKAEKMIEDYRKRIKKEVAAPIAEFEKKCKELVIMINDQRKGFKEAAATIEEDRVAAKKILVDEVLDILITHSELDSAYKQKVELKSKYLTKTMSIANVHNDVSKQIEKLEIEQQLYNAKKDQITLYCGVVSSDNLDIQSDPYVKMLDTYSVDDVKRFIDEFVVKANTPKPGPVKPAPAAPVMGFKEPKLTELFTEIWNIIGTEKQFEDLEDFMKINDIKYTVKNE